MSWLKKWHPDCGVREEIWLLRAQLEVLLDVDAKLDRLLSGELTFDSFTITQGDTDMALALPDAGSTLVFTATPTLAGQPVTLPVGTVPTWTSSDEGNGPVTVDSTGLIATTVLGAGVTVGEQITYTITATNEAGTVVSQFITITIGQATPTASFDGFNVVQSS